MLASSRNDAPNVDFPLCRDPRHEAVIRRALVRACDLLRDRLPEGKLAALILTGSFARGEGSVMSAGGRLRVLGDIEFLVVFASAVDYYAYRTRMADWAKDATQAVRDEVEVDVEFGPVGIEYLRRYASPSIFVYDLIRHGKVVWGPHDIVKLVREFGPEKIPPTDALYLLFNRTIEQLEAWDRVPTLDGRALWDLAYQRLKLMLDLAGSALAFSGRHEPSYEARPAAFARLLAETPSLAAAMPPAFVPELERAARLKIAPGDGSGVLAGDMTLDAQRAWIRSRMATAAPAVTALLRWELAALLDTDGDVPGLLRRWLRTPSFRRRVWDWTKLAVNPRRSPVPLSRLRAARLFLTSTPRGLLYAAAALAYLNLVHPTIPPRRIAALLPVQSAALRHRPDAERGVITALWRWCVRNT
ncbi:MAG: hypothetical protein HYU41_07960 [Candidatus Rokubacteria bacterium]|nr:hypothetical protein [Candidatus Rokubacteria bacterium]